jgi:hypothetical protein
MQTISGVYNITVSSRYQIPWHRGEENHHHELWRNVDAV